MITKELLKEYMVDWLQPYAIYELESEDILGDIVLPEQLAEHLADKIWKMNDRIKINSVNSVLSKEKQDLFDSVYGGDGFDHAP